MTDSPASATWVLRQRARAAILPPITKPQHLTQLPLLLLLPQPQPPPQPIIITLISIIIVAVSSPKTDALIPPVSLLHAHGAVRSTHAHEIHN